jgi:hypothetical protein
MPRCRMMFPLKNDKGSVSLDSEVTAFFCTLQRMFLCLMFYEQELLNFLLWTSNCLATALLHYVKN